MDEIARTNGAETKPSELECPGSFKADFLNSITSVDEQLWTSYAAALADRMPPPGVHVIFPSYREGSKLKIRVSEQESKLLLTIKLAQMGYYCSPETPTGSVYQITGKTIKRSALTDLTVYNSAGVRLIDIEFKKGGATVKKKDKTSIAKDLEKLLSEKGNGFWFHTLKSANRLTLGTLWSVMISELKALARRLGVTAVEKTITFHFSVLRQGFSVERTIHFRPEDCGENWLDDMIPAAYLIVNDNLSMIKDHGWVVRCRGSA